MNHHIKETLKYTIETHWIEGLIIGIISIAIFNVIYSFYKSVTFCSTYLFLIGLSPSLIPLKGVLCG